MSAIYTTCPICFQLKMDGHACAVSSGAPEHPKVKTYRESMEAIIAVLGTGACTQNTCEGCQCETYEALRIAHEALGREFP